MSKLILPDRKRCQGEFKPGSFMTLGPRSYQRCENKPAIIVTEKKAGPDGQHGSMSLCTDCREVLYQQQDRNNFTEEPI